MIEPARPFLDDFTIANMLIGLRPQLAADVCAALDAALEDGSRFDSERRERLRSFRAELNGGMHDGRG